MNEFDPPTWRSPRRQTRASPSQPGRILLVDDYEDARANLREALEQAGHVVADVANGQQALTFLVSHSHEPVSLIIVDLEMPVMDGWRFIDLLKCYVKLSKIPVIVVTARPDAHLERITHRAVYGCLQAPYELAKLLTMVDTCLNPGSTPGSGAVHAGRH